MIDSGKYFDRYGDVVFASEFGNDLYWLRHPDHIIELLVPKASHFTKRSHDLGGILGNGLITADGELWLRQRQLIQPAFHRDRIARFESVVRSQAERLIESWRPGEVRDINREMMRVTLGVICEALFDHDIHEVADEIERAMTVFQTSQDRREVGEAIRVVDEIIFDMIERRRVDRGGDLLSQLVVAAHDEGLMSNQQLRDELITLMLAGHETTSQALTWAWYLLSQHPEIEQRFHEELDGDYVERVARETLRLYPPSYALPRIAAVDTELAGYTIPAGSQVIGFIFWTHRDPRWFDDPEAFEPDRFLPESGPAKHPRAYLPFGAGGRSCIGKALGMLELKVILPIIGRRFSLRLHPDQEIGLEPSITLRPKYGMRMVLEAR